MKVHRHAAAAKRFFREQLLAEVLVFGSDRMVTIQECIVAAMGTFHHAKRNNLYAAAKRLQDLHSRISATPLSSSAAPLGLCPTFCTLFPPPLLSISLFSARLRQCRLSPFYSLSRQKNPVIVDESSGPDDDQELDTFIPAISKSNIEQRSHSKKKGKAVRQKTKKALPLPTSAQPHTSSPSASLAVVFKKYGLREKIAAVACFALLFYVKSFDVQAEKRSRGDSTRSDSSYSTDSSFLSRCLFLPPQSSHQQSTQLQKTEEEVSSIDDVVSRSFLCTVSLLRYIPV